MNNLSTYIIEKLKINKSTNLYHYHPKDKDELKSLITKLIEERGKDADLNDIDVSDITDMYELFYGLDPHKIDISEWNVSNVKNMELMFDNCINFNSDLNKWDVSNVKNMEAMFVRCINFNSDLSNWDVSNVTNMYSMFCNCENFNSDLSNWDVSNVKDMKDMFGGCKSLKQIPSWYMKEGLNESIWSDMQDRSSGEVVRKEDDIEHLDY